MKQKKITISISPDIQVLCEIFDIKPEALCKQFMDDLTSNHGNGGSDERHMAKDYFLRGGISSQRGLDCDIEDAVHRFEGIYQSSYPSNSNPEWKEQRKVLLKQHREYWMSRIKNHLPKK